MNNTSKPFARKMQTFADTARVFCAVLLPITLLAVVGCSTTNSERVRREQTESYRTNLLAETDALLQQYPSPLTVQDCMDIARERSLKLAGARLAERLARIDSHVAFSAFLPEVSYQFEATSLSEPAEKRIGEDAIEMQDQKVRMNTLQITQPIFAPNAWLMYVSSRRGVDIRSLARERAEQLLDLQVVKLFYQYSVSSDRLDSLRRQLDASDALLREATAMNKAGYLLDADCQKIQAYRTSRQQQLSSLQREVALAQSRLLETMNLWPLAQVDFQRESAQAMPSMSSASTNESVLSKSLEEWIYVAWLNRLELYSGDRSIELRKNEILRAIASFLPSLYGFANFYTTSDSYTVNDRYWGSGLQATLSVFSGFRTINAYLAARSELKQAYVDREETSLSIMVQVLEAYKNFQDIDQQCEVARQTATAARSELSSVKASYEAGLAPLSSYLDAWASSEAADANLKNADYAQALTLYVFRDVTGLNKENNDEKK